MSVLLAEMKKQYADEIQEKMEPSVWQKIKKFFAGWFTYFENSIAIF